MQPTILLKFKAIHQFLPVLSRHDAIGETSLEIQKSLIDLGYDSEIFVEHVIEPTKTITKYFTNYNSNSNDLVIYHHSIGSSLAQFVSNLSSKKLLFYHNITPSQFFTNYDQMVVSQLDQGREQLKILSKSFEFAMTSSEYNKSELHSYGFDYILDMQYFLNLPRFDEIQLDKKIINLYKNTTNLLFVGRRSPNKKVEDVMKIFAYYKIFNPNSKLFLLGGSWSVEKYVQRLEQLKQKLKIENDDLIMIESLSDKELKSYFNVADFFISMSEHEGFGIPFVESMYFKVPIIAFNSSAVPNTLGGAGILLNHKNFSEIAQLLDMILSEKPLREKIIKKQNERLTYFSNHKATILLKNNIELVLNSST